MSQVTTSGKANHTMNTTDMTYIRRDINRLQTKADFLRRYETLLEQFEPSKTYDADETYVSVDANWGRDIDFTVHGPAAKSVMAILRRAIASGKWDKATDSYYFKLTRTIDGLNVTIQSSRNAVCKKVVVGVEEKVIPAVEAKPETVEEVEVVEWVCGTLAGDDE